MCSSHLNSSKTSQPLKEDFLCTLWMSSVLRPSRAQSNRFVLPKNSCKNLLVSMVSISSETTKWEVSEYRNDMLNSGSMVKPMWCQILSAFQSPRMPRLWPSKGAVPNSWIASAKSCICQARSECAKQRVGCCVCVWSLSFFDHKTDLQQH